MVQLIQSKPDSVISIRWRRNGEVRQAQVRTRAVKVPDEEGHLRPVGFVGIASEIVCKRIGPLSAAKESVRWVLENTLQIVQFIKGLATGSVSVRMVGGPIFIAQVAGQTARQGLPTLLSFMALLSVNLALLNILPIPLLDGGQLLIMAIESIKGQPLSQRQRMVIQQLGLVLIIMLIAVVFFNDVTR
jgi:regulator of sigma E protease